MDSEVSFEQKGKSLIIVSVLFMFILNELRLGSFIRLAPSF